ncbi:MAG: NAD(P)H-dependent oxidoreductase subunit E [Planctomycetes bacterium]|nr:NAD(P)H-dependent oxidoreductase subunit E [Planctomycetota bacterium]
MGKSCSCIGCDGVLEAHPDAKKELEAYIDSLPIGDDIDANRGYLIQSLHKAQDVFGYLPESVQLFVANKLKIHLSEVYGVISFYSYFTDVPVGKYKINVCTGTACFVRGSMKILDELSRHLGIKEGETTEDKRFSLGGLRCVGACSLAPVVMVNDKVYGNVTPQMVQEILNDCE